MCLNDLFWNLLILLKKRNKLLFDKPGIHLERCKQSVFPCDRMNYYPDVLYV